MPQKTISKSKNKTRRLANSRRKKGVDKQKSVVLLFGQAKGKRRSALPERKGVREWKGCWCYSLGLYSRRSAPSPFDFEKNDRPADD